jgi:hypothetical protein
LSEPHPYLHYKEETTSLPMRGGDESIRPKIALAADEEISPYA